MWPRSLSSCWPLARPLFKISLIATRILQILWGVGRRRLLVETSHPSILACESPISISCTVSPACRKPSTADQNLSSTSFLLWPKTCRLSTYWMCQNCPAGALCPSLSRSDSVSPARPQIRSLRFWTHHIAQDHPIGTTRTLGYIHCSGCTLAPSKDSTPSCPARILLSPKNWRRPTGISMV